MRLMLKPEEDVMDMITGGSILGDIKGAFKSVGKAVKSIGSKVGDLEDKARKTVSKTISSVRKGANKVGKVVKKGATQLGDKVVEVAKSKQVKRFGRKVASQLIRRGIPVASQALGSALGSTLATISGNPELAPMAGKLGAQLGQRGGQELSKYVSRKTGYGVARLPSGVVLPMKGMPNRGGIRKMTDGKGFMPAGDKSGSGIMVSSPEPPSDVIQLGSPYAKIQSASMNPFIAPSIQLAGKKFGAGFTPAG